MERTKRRLMQSEDERDVLKEEAMRLVNQCDGELLDVKTLVHACICMDDSMLDMRVSSAVTEFIRSCSSRRAALMSRYKEAKSLVNKSQEIPETSNDDISLPKEHDSLKRCLKDLYKVLDKLNKCDSHLAKVKAESYIARFEVERAMLLTEKSKVNKALLSWCDRNKSSQTRLWDEHGEVTEALLMALDTDIDEDILKAVQTDIGNTLEAMESQKKIKPLKKRELKKPINNQKTPNQDLTLFGSRC